MRLCEESPFEAAQIPNSENRRCQPFPHHWRKTAPDRSSRGEEQAAGGSLKRHTRAIRVGKRRRIWAHTCRVVALSPQWLSQIACACSHASCDLAMLVQCMWGRRLLAHAEVYRHSAHLNKERHATGHGTVPRGAATELLPERQGRPYLTLTGNHKGAPKVVRRTWVPGGLCSLSGYSCARNQGCKAHRRGSSISPGPC